MDPYDVLNLPRNFTADQLRANYRQLALQLHPDKCGARLGPQRAAEMFQVLTSAYRELCAELRARASDRSWDELRAEAAVAAEAMAAQQAGGDGKRFDLSRFNAVFDAERPASDAYTRGYESWMRRADPEDERSRADEERRRRRRELTVYQEPQALPAMAPTGGGGRRGAQGYTELGLERIPDFSGAAGSGVAFTDYRLAHTRSRLLDAEDETAGRKRVAASDGVTMEKLQAARTNQSFAMTDEEAQRAAVDGLARKEAEDRRQAALREADRANAERYERMQRRFLTFRS